MCVYENRYGEVIYDKNGLLVCHICGKSCVKLGVHVWRAHGILTEEYKERFGLAKGVGLITKDHKESLGKTMKKSKKSMENLSLGKPYIFKKGCVGRSTNTLRAQTKLELRNKMLLINIKNAYRFKEIQRMRERNAKLRDNAPFPPYIGKFNAKGELVNTLKLRYSEILNGKRVATYYRNVGEYYAKAVRVKGKIKVVKDNGGSTVYTSLWREVGWELYIENQRKTKSL